MPFPLQIRRTAKGQHRLSNFGRPDQQHVVASSATLNVARSSLSSLSEVEVRKCEWGLQCGEARQASPPANQALRAQAVVGLPAESPRGLAIVVNQRLPAWIRAWPSTSGQKLRS
jgi:hypothetical protein